MRTKWKIALLAVAGGMLAGLTAVAPASAMSPIGPSATGRSEGSSLVESVRHRRWVGRRDAHYFYPRHFRYRPYYYSYAPYGYYRPYYDAYADPYYVPYYSAPRYYAPPRFYGYGYGYYGPRVRVRIGF
jgi:hypothetical protein